MRVKTHANVQLSDDEFVAECMDKLIKKYPQIAGYTFERPEDQEVINVLMWGDFELTD